MTKEVNAAIKELQEKYVESNNVKIDSHLGLRLATLNMLQAEMAIPDAELENVADRMGDEVINTSEREWVGGMPDFRPLVVTTTLGDVMRLVNG